MQSYKVFIGSVNIECFSSLLDCSGLHRYLSENSHSITKNVAEADLIIISSCGFLNSMQQLCIDLFKAYSTQKKAHAKIIMYGCLVKINKELLQKYDLIAIENKDGPALDQIFYTKRKFTTNDTHCKTERKNDFAINEKQDSWKNIPFILTRILSPFSKNIRLNFKKILSDVLWENRICVTIAKGCTGKCSYCVIKKASGNLRSRDKGEILSDIKESYNPSANIVLVADDCSDYGVGEGTGFITLAHAIHKEFPELSIDYFALGPTQLEKRPKEFIQLFEDVNTDIVVIPIQHGSNRIIKSMNRFYNVNTVIGVVDAIKKASTNTTLCGQFIVGFPGETTIDFLKTLQAAKHFDYLVASQHSGLKGAASTKLPNQKPEFLIKLRRLIFFVFANFTTAYRLFTKKIKDIYYEQNKKQNQYILSQAI